jgi:hypothetical protein
MFTFSETTDKLDNYLRTLDIDDPARIMELEEANILLLPSLYELFEHVAEAFYEYCTLNHPEHSIEYCSPTKSLKTLCSTTGNILLPTIITSYTFLPTLLNIISGFLHDRLKQRAREREIIRESGVNLPEETHIEFKILVTKKNRKSKTISYKGSSKTLAESFEKIDLNEIFAD